MVCARSCRDEKKSLDNPLGWRFYAAIHWFDETKWSNFKYFNAQSDPLPTTHDRNLYWSQCWHGSWYFVPWHRGYLIAFEPVIRAQIVALGGPADWTLPYWNYFAAGQQAIPNGVRGVPQGPMAATIRCLRTYRYGRNSDGVVVIPLHDPDSGARHRPRRTR